MSTPSDLVRVPTSTALVRVLGLVAVVAGLLVVLAYQITQPMIAENRREAVERAVFKVIPGAVKRVDFVIGPQGLIRAGEATEGETVYAGLDANGTLKGIALQAAAQGYQDTIRVLYGYSPDCRCITGIHVLQMAETPGLGDKIATDPGFLANFKALDASLDAVGQALAHPIKTVKHGTKTGPWEIDAISGATISSRAVGKMLDASAERNIPVLVKHLDRLREAR